MALCDFNKINIFLSILIDFFLCDIFNKLKVFKNSEKLSYFIEKLTGKATTFYVILLKPLTKPIASGTMLFRLRLATYNRTFEVWRV